LTGDSLPAPFRLGCVKFLLETLRIILVSTLPKENGCYYADNMLMTKELD
jgi:hypothetical protein